MLKRIDFLLQINKEDTEQLSDLKNQYLLLYNISFQLTKMVMKETIIYSPKQVHSIVQLLEDLKTGDIENTKQFLSYVQQKIQ